MTHHMIETHHSKGHRVSEALFHVTILRNAWRSKHGKQLIPTIAAAQFSLLRSTIVLLAIALLFPLSTFNSVHFIWFKMKTSGSVPLNACLLIWYFVSEAHDINKSSHLSSDQRYSLKNKPRRLPRRQNQSAMIMQSELIFVLVFIPNVESKLPGNFFLGIILWMALQMQT